MTERQNLGRSGEDLAVAYLAAKGYAVLERNWRLGHKEIDIICTDGVLIIIVEVKTRRHEEEYPEELLDYRKKRNLLCAGAAYLKQKGWERELRFDLLLITGPRMDVEHIPDAVQVIDL